MNPPEDYAVDDDAADIVEQSSPRQELVAYPTSGTRQGDGEEIEGKVEEDDDMAASWAGQPAIKGSTESMRMALLTFSLIGLQ
jgi:solute carrier family 45 protein 1/2/4